MLDHAVLDALGMQQFEPARKDGKAVPSIMRRSLRFKHPGSETAIPSEGVVRHEYSCFLQVCGPRTGAPARDRSPDSRLLSVGLSRDEKAAASGAGKWSGTGPGSCVVQGLWSGREDP